MITQIYFVPRQTEKRKRAFFEWKSIDLFSKVSLKCRGNVTYKSVHHPIPTRGNKEYPGKFQNKSVSSLSVECPGIFSSWPNGRGGEVIF